MGWLWGGTTINVNVPQNATINLNVTVPADGRLDAILESLDYLKGKVDQIMSAETDALAKLDAIETTLTKISAESSASVNEIAALKAEIAALPVSVPQSVMDKIDSLAAHAKAIDDLVPDA